MPTDTTEKGLEDTITDYIVTRSGYERGYTAEYSKTAALDEGRLLRFLRATQGEKLSRYNILGSDLKKQSLIARISSEIEKRGIIAALRNGIEIYPAGKIDLYNYLPSDKNQTAKENFEKNIFSITRQLHYSAANENSIDLVIFLNGLPIITLELKNQFTHQNYEDAIEQYKTDRDPREPLLHSGRCMVHLAADDSEIWMCTSLNGKNSAFLPFNKGNCDGKGNPPNPDGLKTDYLWKDILSKHELADIIENYAQKIEKTDPDTKKKKQIQIFPRYHQLAVVRALLADARHNGAGKRYLIQHSAGSGKSNSIAWLALQLVPLEQNGHPVFDSVLVVTDRINLDNQIKNTIRGIAQMRNIIGHADSASDLRVLLTQGKKIIITTVNKFPFILDTIGSEHQDKNFAIIIDEAHSSQSGRMSAAMNLVLSTPAEYTKNGDADEEESIEDTINKIVEGKRMVKNASYFAFTATPKNKTLEMFGTPFKEDGAIKHKPFHQYTMKQAIQEGFILDVLQNYTPVASYYKLIKTIESDPEFDKKKAEKKLRGFVERNEYTIGEKAKIIVDHYHTQVSAKIGGKGRAMVVCRDIETAVKYYHAIVKQLEARKSPYKAIIAFSGEKEIDGIKVTESSLNGFPGTAIEKTFKTEPYRFLVVANKFQTGYDEPLLHTMYVDKALSDVKAVQTLSRLNRACPGKYDTFVLDFFNPVDVIQNAFSKYYKTTILSEETDPNKLYDLIQDLRDAEIFSDNDVETVVSNYLKGIERAVFDPILDACSTRYSNTLDIDGQIKFKGSAKTYLRTYGFLAAILPFANPDWEKLSIFLHHLVPKLPTPQAEDLTEGLLTAVDMESYRVEALQTMKIQLEDVDGEIKPVPTKGPLGKQDPEMDTLSNILLNFHDMWGNIEWNDEDRIKKQIAELPKIVARNEAYQNAMKNSDEENARLESEKILRNVVTEMIQDNLELYKQYSDNAPFRKWLEAMVFNTTYSPSRKGEV